MGVRAHTAKSGYGSHADRGGKGEGGKDPQRIRRRISERGYSGGEARLKKKKKEEKSKLGSTPRREKRGGGGGGG